MEGFGEASSLRKALTPCPLSRCGRSGVRRLRRAPACRGGAEALGAQDQGHLRGLPQTASAGVVLGAGRLIARRDDGTQTTT